MCMMSTIAFSKSVIDARGRPEGIIMISTPPQKGLGPRSGKAVLVPLRKSKDEL